MDRLNQCFLNILRAALEGQSLSVCPELTAEEWAQLFELAQCHHVLPMVFQVVHRLPELQDAPVMARAKQLIRQQIVLQTRKTCDFLSLTQALHAAGIRPLVVKGIICRNLYPYPDHRISGDEDMLIPPEITFDCHQVLTSFGMETDTDPRQFVEVYEIPYRSQKSPLYIELHRYLFPPESEAYGDLNRFFDGVFNRAVAETIQGVPVLTMCPTDHLFYLICHAFKHFLHSGFGIRQVCDIIMYTNAYGNQIHWQKVLENCRAIHAELFAAAIFRIGARQLVFDPQRACYPAEWQQIEVDETNMLEDLLTGGLYGDATMSRRHSSSITLDAVAARKTGRKSGSALMLSLFPPAKKLEASYPYLKDKPYLLPAAWASRILKYGKETRTDRSSNASDALKIGARRIDLFREYGIIE